jgi:uncharacterized protein (TIGR03382 family)
MWRNLVLGSLCVGALSATALANGRAPGSSTVNFRKGMESHVLVGTTFGLVRSDDSGATWHWMCEDAVGYGGMYDPDYGYTSTGALFATTFDGLKVNRDGCIFAPSTLSPEPPTVKFFSVIAVGPDNAVYAAAADPTDGKIYKSLDDGVTFPVSAMPGQVNDWWQSIEVAPSNANIVYVAGYRLPAGQPKQFLVLRSDNGGTSYTPLPTTDFATMPNSTIEIVGISKTNPQLVYARVVLEDNSVSDALYRSTNGGANWTRILGEAGAISFVVRGNGDLVAATQGLGSFKSVNNGTDWTPLAGAPHINCLAENAAGELWACTQNYGSQTVPSDGFGVMKTTDLVTWTGVLKFQDIADPVSCSAGSPQKDKCDTQLWCGLCSQLGCDPARTCDATGADMTPVVPPPPAKGCCQTGSDGLPGLLVIGLAITGILLRRRRCSVA